MQEFSSVTASSYDADSLAPMLTDKAADGWTVISIVAAGTNIVAYLQREADDSTAESTSDVGETPDDTSTDDTTASDYPASIGATDVGSTDVAVEAEEEAASADDAAPYVPAAAASVITAGTPADETSSAVDEPAGWATAPESTTSDAGTSDAGTTDAGGEATGGEATGDSTEASLAGLVAEVEAADATPEPAAEAPAVEPPPVESTVPAGWYADPSGRFELRYWDGTAWTEHVSRAGQQFTDPPVA